MKTFFFRGKWINPVWPHGVIDTGLYIIVVLDCCLTDLSWTDVDLTSSNSHRTLHWNLNEISDISIPEIATENIYMTLALFRPGFGYIGFIPRLHSITTILTHWSRNNMAAIFLTTFSNEFSWMKMHKFRLRFHWSLFPRVQWAIFQHWFR